MEKIGFNRGLEPESESQKEGEQEVDSEGLRERLAALRDEELAKKAEGKKHDVHFENFNPEELTDKDLEIYQKFDEQTLTPEDFSNYQKTFGKKEAKDIGKDTSSNLMAWLSNQLGKKEVMKWYNPEMYDFLYGEEKDKK